MAFRQQHSVNAVPRAQGKNGGGVDRREDTDGLVGALWVGRSHVRGWNEHEVLSPSFLVTQLCGELGDRDLSPRGFYPQNVNSHLSASTKSLRFRPRSKAGQRT